MTRLFTKDEMLDSAVESSVLLDAAKVVQESSPPINQRAIREQQDWQQVANLVVGAKVKVNAE